MLQIKAKEIKPVQLDTNQYQFETVCLNQTLTFKENLVGSWV